MQRHDHRLTRTSHERRNTDVVFDFSGLESPDLGGMVLVLTARQIVDADDRRVWARSMSSRMRELLQALGLENFFEDLPGNDDYIQ